MGESVSPSRLDSAASTRVPSISELELRKFRHARQ